MRVLYVPRIDAQKVVGGDVIYAQFVGDAMRRLGVEFQVVPPVELLSHPGGDLVFLTQIYQTESAERTLAWAETNGMPVFISPLFEEGLPMMYRQAVRLQSKWRYLDRAFGAQISEVLYTTWQTMRRLQNPTWLRQRSLLQRVHLVPNTYYELSHLCKWFKLTKPQASVVRLGIDPALFNLKNAQTPSALPDTLVGLEESYVLEVGLISARKNQVGLLQALFDSSELIVLLGRKNPYEPDYYDEVKQLAQARGNVMMLDHVDALHFPALYGHAALHILPSWSERPGMVTLEAAACGCKVISTNRSPIDEYLGDRVLPCDPAKPTTIYAAVQNALRSDLDREFSPYVLDHYTWDKTADSLVQVFAKG